MSALVAFIAGLAFGVGLLLSGMGNPAKVQNFLDFFGHWDPSLAFVMGGAIGVGVLAFTWGKRRSRSVLGEPMDLPTAQRLDARLCVGAALFGIGWGLAGFCPGPAVMNLATGSAEVLWFVGAMLVGMVAERVWVARERG